MTYFMRPASVQLNPGSRILAVNLAKDLDDDKRFTFSKSNGGISHRKAKDTQPRA